ncbi:hypothetical protein [Bacteroides reticulotermitis]|uniref:hypothetical protein n=1 Tax=Bacteroides reticulotermitis TaxID=1133319 RepID=UPI003A87EE81
MSDIVIKTRSIPNNPRSKNYPAGTTVTPSSGGSSTVIGGGGASIDIVGESSQKALTDKNVLSSLRAIAEILSRIIKSDDDTELSEENTLSSLRSLSTFLRKDSDDTAAGLITFLQGLVAKRTIDAEAGLNIGTFATGATGGNLDAAGNAELNSLIVRLKAEVQSLNVTDSAKIKTLEVLELLKGKVITGTLISGDEVKATLIEAIQIIGDNIIANETVAGKNITASEKVTGKSLVAKEDISGVTADILDKTTTLNLLVKNLAEIYDLNVSHVATLMGTIVKEYISSESFVSGFAGEGMKIYKALNGDWNMEIDNLTVRKIFSVFELVVQRITHQGGMVIRSAAGGKLKKVTDGGTYWRCEHDSTDDFALNDQIICQAFTGNQAKRYWRLVTSAGVGYFNLSKADCEAGSSNPEAGDEVAVLGNRTNTARQKAQIDCAVGDNAPYRDDYDNINSYSLAGKLITRTGNLSGITDAVFGVLSGSGLYGTNVYLKGTFRLISGKTVEEAITDAQVLAQEYSDNKLTTFKTTTYQSDIQVLQESISLKVSSATYQQDQSLVTTRLSAAEAKITDEAIRFTVKSQTETIAKSAVDGIQVGGRNLWKESSTLKAYPKGSDHGNTAWANITEDGITFTRITPINSGNFYFRPFLVPISFKKGDSYTISFQYRTAQISDIGLYNYLLASGISAQVPPSSEWTSFSKTYIAEYDRNVPVDMLFGFATLEQGKAFDVRLLKLEKGNKATDWTPASEDIENRVTTVETNFEIREGQISSKVSEATTAATNAKQSETNASGSAGIASSKAGEASNYAGNAKKSADDANASLLSVISKESSINQTANSIALQVTEVTQKAKDAAVSATESSNAAELAMAMSKGKMLYRDATFLKGYNDVKVYNNQNNGAVTITREAGAPNGYCLKIETLGTTQPGLGGFYFGTPASRSKIFIARILAKIPEGYEIAFTSNATGDNPTRKWLTSYKGTGKWEEYAHKIICGIEGSFANTNFFYLHKGNSGTITTTEPVTWYLAYASVFDATNAEIDYLADAAEKYTTKTEFSTSITQLSNSIELKVAKTDFNALDIRVSTAETTITQHTNSIALKANQSDLSVLGNRVSAAELKITPVEINLTVKTQTENIAKAAAKRTEVVVDATGLDVNTYYPVTIGMSVSSLYTITVGRPLDASMGVPPWSTHQGGFSALCKWTSNGNGWGTIPVQRIILSFTHAFASYVVPLGSIGQMDFSNNEYIYVRGGSKYNVVVEGAAEVPVTLHSETYLVNGQSISPLTEIVTPIPDLSTKLAKTEFTSELVILNNSIATKVSQTTFDQLGNTVSNHTTQLTQLPNTIDARITTQTNEGGIIKTNVESWFTMSGNTISLGAKTINISGATVFNSLATQTQAQGYAGDALTDAKDYTDNLKTTLGGMAFQDQVTLAKLDSTIIDGGFLKTTLIAANSITADKIDVDSVRAAVVTADTIAALNITTGNLTVTDGAKIGGWSVEGNALIIRSAAAAKLIVQPDSTRSLRINDNSSSLMNIMARGIIGINIYTEQPAGTGVYVISQTGGTAIASYGSHIFRQRPGETWNAPGVLKCAEINGATGGVNWQWGDGFSSLSISKEGDGGYRIYHNLGHTEYFIHALPFVTWTNGQWHESVPCYVDITSSSIKLFFKSGSNNTCSPSYFQLMFFGRNRNA